MTSAHHAFEALDSGQMIRSRSSSSEMGVFMSSITMQSFAPFILWKRASRLVRRELFVT